MSSITAQPDTTEKPERPNRRKKVAFVTAPSAVEAHALQGVLDRLGIESTTASEAELPGRTMSELALDCIRPADVVIGVLAQGPMSHNVYFDLGLARGLGKRILLVAKPKAIPTAVSLGLPYIRSAPDNTEGIKFALAQLFAVPHHGGRPVEPVTRQTRPIEGLADELLAQLQCGQQPPTEDKLPEVIGRAIRESGATVVSSPRPADGVNPDMAVWSDDLEPWIHNPLLIEFKSNVRSKGEVRQLVRQLRRYMEKVTVSTALVIYRGADASVVKEMHSPEVLFVSAEDFLDSLRDSGFGDVVRRLRELSNHRAS